MAESFSKNFIDYEEYPQSADIQNRCVSMIGRLFHAPVASDGTGAVGTSCVGSSEAIMLAVLAMKKRWKNRRIAAGLSIDKPNIIMSSGKTLPHLVIFSLHVYMCPFCRLRARTSC